MGHCKLTAWLPPSPREMSAAPLTLVQDIAISGQVEAKDISWYQSKWNEHPRAVQETGRGGIARNAYK